MHFPTQHPIAEQAESKQFGSMVSKVAKLGVNEHPGGNTILAGKQSK